MPTLGWVVLGQVHEPPTTQRVALAACLLGPLLGRVLAEREAAAGDWRTNMLKKVILCTDVN